MGHWQAQPGQALLWLALLMPMLIGIAGLAIDGATVFTARRELQSVADGAARAGATQVDVGSLRAADGSALRLAPGTGPHTAIGTATAYLASRSKSDIQWPNGLSWRVDVNGPDVSVLVQATVPTAFLRILHIESVPIDAASSADLRHGIGAPVE
jgi:Flp pilus assembly protein TadG